MGRDIFFYSISIDPDLRHAAVLKAYAEKYQAGPGWMFLTGKKDDIETISRKLGLYSAPDPSNPDGHTPMLLVGNEVTGQWMRNSAIDNPKFLATTIGDWLNSWQTSQPAGHVVRRRPRRSTFDPANTRSRTTAPPATRSAAAITSGRTWRASRRRATASG